MEKFIFLCLFVRNAILLIEISILDMQTTEQQTGPQSSFKFIKLHYQYLYLYYKLILCLLYKSHDHLICITFVYQRSECSLFSCHYHLIIAVVLAREWSGCQQFDESSISVFKGNSSVLRGYHRSCQE